MVATGQAGSASVGWAKRSVPIICSARLIGAGDVGTRRFAALCPRYNLIARFGGHGARLRGGPRKWNAERECRAMAKLALNPDLAAVRRRRDFYGERTGWVRPDDGLLVRDLNGNGTIDDITEMFGTAPPARFATKVERTLACM